MLQRVQPPRRPAFLQRDLLLIPLMFLFSEHTEVPLQTVASLPRVQTLLAGWTFHSRDIIQVNLCLGIKCKLYTHVYKESYLLTHFP